MPRVFCFEGNIGSGKTTTIRDVAAELKRLGYSVQCLCEPVEEWQQKDSDGYSPLERFYQNPEQYALYFQMIVLYTLHMRNMRIDPNVDYVLLERSTQASIRVFTELSNETGCIRDSEFDALRMFAKHIEAGVHVEAYVYLRCRPHVARQRVYHRGRREENSISQEYLDALHDKHEAWLIEDGHCLVADANTIKGTVEYDDMVRGCAMDILGHVEVTHI